MNEYIPCKRRDPTAWEAIGRIWHEEKERRKREAQERRARNVSTLNLRTGRCHEKSGG